MSDEMFSNVLDLASFTKLATMARDAAKLVNDLEGFGYWQGSIDTATALIGALEKVGFGNVN